MHSDNVKSYFKINIWNKNHLYILASCLSQSIIYANFNFPGDKSK